jgi:hypothetical protein
VSMGSNGNAVEAERRERENRLVTWATASSTVSALQCIAPQGVSATRHHPPPSR